MGRHMHRSDSKQLATIVNREELTKKQGLALSEQNLKDRFTVVHMLKIFMTLFLAVKAKQCLKVLVHKNSLLE